MDIVWAAVGGGAGALLGSLLAMVLGRLAPEKWRRGIITIVSLVAAIVGGRVGVTLYENQASAPASIEAQLLANRDIGPLVQSWKQADPVSYRGFVARLSAGERSGQDFSSLVNVVRAQLLEAAKPRLAHLDDAHTVELIHISRAEFAQLATSHPQTCRPMFMGEGIGDITPYISADLRTRELAVVQAAFQVDMSAQQNELTGKALTDAISNLGVSTRAVVGNDVALLANGADITGHERRYCEVVVALYEQMEAMPGAQAASLMRGMRDAS